MIGLVRISYDLRKRVIFLSVSEHLSTQSLLINTRTLGKELYSQEIYLKAKIKEQMSPHLNLGCHCHWHGTSQGHG